MIINQDYQLVDVEKLRPHPQNPRVNDLGAIRESIDINGFYGALVVNKPTGHILAGNHRYKAALEQQIKELPVIFVDVDKSTALRIIAADNRTSDLAGYDDAALAALLDQLPSLAGTGFSDDEFNALCSELDPTTESNDSAQAPAPAIDKAKELQAKWKTARGQIWQVGDHRLMCGDCRSKEDVSALVDGVKINVAFTSPPYASQRKYDEESGFTPIRPDEYVDWFELVQAGVKEHLADDGSWFVNIKASAAGLDTYLYVHDLVIAHVRRWGWHYGTELCWKRPGVPMGVSRRFKNQFEPVFQFSFNDWKIRPSAVMHKSPNVPISKAPGLNYKWADRQGIGGGAVHDNEIVAGMAYPGNMISAGNARSHGHSAAFPVGLPTFFIKAYSDPNDVIYDPFMGSGTTAVAAEQEGRRALGMEISAAYLAVQLERFAELGLTPTLIETR